MCLCKYMYVADAKKKWRHTYSCKAWTCRRWRCGSSRPRTGIRRLLIGWFRCAADIPDMTHFRSAICKTLAGTLQSMKNILLSCITKETYVRTNSDCNFDIELKIPFYPQFRWRNVRVISVTFSANIGTGSHMWHRFVGLVKIQFSPHIVIISV